MAVYYFAQSDLENALGVNTVKAIFDDDADGVADTGPITACLAYGTSECNSFLRNTEIMTIPPVTIPDELMFAAVDFGCAYAVRRRPDVVRAMGEKSWTDFRDSAIAKIKRFCDAEQRLPPDVGTPRNVGGTIAPDEPGDFAPEDSAQSRWGRMGDY